MTDDSPSRDTFNTSSFPTILDYDDLEQNADGHITLETNLNIPAGVFFNKRCCKKFSKIHRKAPVPEYLF